MKKLLYIIFLMLMFWSCKEEKPYTILLPPKHFPEIQHPEDNSLTDLRVDLGKRLFFSTIFSIDSSISCASCHKPELAFTDGLPKSIGVKNRTTFRNAPSLFNVAYMTLFMREGSVPSLEQQVPVPIHESTEFDFNILLVAQRMQKDSSWVQLSRGAYNRTPDPFVITRALGAFQRTLFSGTSPFDDYLNGIDSALNAQQKLGFQLFIAHCASCHSGMFFTNEQLANNGLYQQYADSGRMRVTLKYEDMAKFKVPSLRNVALTSPYMHDGSMTTLKEVISHYNTGGKQHPNKSTGIKKLKLTKEEQQAIEAFLHSLTDKKAVEQYTQLLR